MAPPKDETGPQYPIATILKYPFEPPGWIENYTLDPENIRKLPEKCYIFINRKYYVDNKEEKRHFEKHDLLQYLNVPDFLCNETCTLLNGYFGSRGIYNKEDKLESYSTWFRCLVKKVGLKKKEKGLKKKAKTEKDYIWYEMGFFTRWDHSGNCRVVCIDTPEELQSGLKNFFQSHSKPETALPKPPHPLNFKDPFAMHIPLIDQIVMRYDESVWLIRDLIRDVETHRTEATPGALPDFAHMHETSRHTIHVDEVLLVTIDTLKEILLQQKEVYQSLPSPLGKNYTVQAQEYVSFQLQMVKSLNLRSKSNYERLKTEITLAYNMMAAQDNSVVKSIALLTMTFLPATFIAAFFSTTFFTFGDDGWESSKQLWIYWTVTIPSTLLVLAIWGLWIYGPAIGRYLRKKYTEQQKKREGKKKSGMTDP